jgi:hypothetical protein
MKKEGHKREHRGDYKEIHNQPHIWCAKHKWFRWSLAIAGLALIVILLALYFSFIYSVKCENETCWEYKMNQCDRATYTNDVNEVTWFYKIKGSEGEFCKIEVKVLEVKSGLSTSKVLEGKNMECLIPKGVIISPEADSNLCHGELKEEIQSIIIKRLQEYIVNNLGVINEDLLKA